MASPRQSAANRANALKSTGPKSTVGKIRASINATKHGLTQPIDVSIWGEHLAAVVRLLLAEGIEHFQAQELAKKILDYERNLEYQRKRYIDLKNGVSVQYEAPPQALSNLHAAQQLEEAAKSGKPVFDEKLDRDMVKLFNRIAAKSNAQAKHDALKVLRGADRYLRRSANQLSKAIKALEI